MLTKPASKETLTPRKSRFFVDDIKEACFNTHRLGCQESHSCLIATQSPILGQACWLLVLLPCWTIYEDLTGNAGFGSFFCPEYLRFNWKCTVFLSCYKNTNNYPPFGGWPLPDCSKVIVSTECSLCLASAGWHPIRRYDGISDPRDHHSCHGNRLTQLTVPGVMSSLGYKSLDEYAHLLPAEGIWSLVRLLVREAIGSSASLGSGSERQASSDSASRSFTDSGILLQLFLAQPSTERHLVAIWGLGALCLWF